MTRSKDCLDCCGGESEDAVAAAEIGLESPNKAKRESLGACKAPALETVADLTEKCLDSATAAVGAKTPALDMAGLFAAVQRRQLVTEVTGMIRVFLELVRVSENRPSGTL